jgi:hypothetical protein
LLSTNRCGVHECVLGALALESKLTQDSEKQNRKNLQT